MGDFGFWMFCSVVAFCVLMYKLAQLRHEYETREQTPIIVPDLNKDT